MPVDAPRATRHQLLTFRLESDVFALPIDRVREVVEYSRVTKVPGARPYVRGLLNLRGNIIPVVDLRSKLGMEPPERSAKACVIVVEVDLRGRAIVVGALADAVLEVTELEVEVGESVPSYGLEVPSSSLAGIARHEERLVLLLEPDRLFMDMEATDEGDHAVA